MSRAGPIWRAWRSWSTRPRRRWRGSRTRCSSRSRSQLAALPIAADDAKPVMRSLLNVGVDAFDLQQDTKLAAYLLDPADTRYDLGGLLERYCDAELAEGDEVPAGELDFGGTGESTSQRVGRAALGVAVLAPPTDRVVGRARPHAPRCRDRGSPGRGPRAHGARRRGRRRRGAASPE